MIRALCLAMLSALLLLSGCGGARPPAELLTLGPLQAEERSVRADAPTISVRRVTVPDYLDSFDVLRRTGPYSLTRDPDRQWAERPSAGIQRLIETALRRSYIVLDQGADLDLQVNIQAFELPTQGLARLEGSWTLIDRADMQVRQSGQEAIKEAAPGGDITATLTALVAEFARRIDDAISPAG